MLNGIFKAVLVFLLASQFAYASGTHCREDYGDLDPKRPLLSKRNKIIAASGTALAAVAAGLAWGLSTKEHPGKVTGTSWDHAIDVQNYQVVSNEAWCANLRDSKPVMPVNGAGEQPGTWNIRFLRRKVHHTDRVFTGMDSNGHATYRDDDVYRDWCSFEHFDWVTVRTERRNGLNPTVEEGPLPTPTVTLAPLERQLEMKRTYAVEIHYDRDGKDRSHMATPADEATYRQWTVGSDMTLTRNNFGFIRKVVKN